MTDNKESLLRIVQKNNLTLEGLVEDQLVEILLQAFESGDFQLLVAQERDYAKLTYLPYREVAILKKRVKGLELTLEAIKALI